MKKIDQRNLYRRGASKFWYYKRLIYGKRIRFSCETTDLETARRRRDLYESRRGIGRVPVPILESPTLREFAKRYLREDVGHLAASTRGDRGVYLKARTEPDELAHGAEPVTDGVLMQHLGDVRLDAITAARLREFWVAVIETPFTDAKGGERKRAAGTGRHYINVLGSVLQYARDVGVLDGPDAVEEFRKQLKRRSRTKGGRAAAMEHIRPIERPDEISRLVAAAREEGPLPYALVLALLDAGLRLGEALGLRWGAVAFGSDAAVPPDRHLVIRENRPRGGDPEPPKSGRPRVVALSARLRDALADLYRDRFEPGPDALIFESRETSDRVIDPFNFRKREWRRILKRAEIGHRAMKDLRDTYASVLVSCGVNVAYLSKQLGHSDIQVTVRHYARWCGREEYREPMRLQPGEVPADLLARIAPDWPHDWPHLENLDPTPSRNPANNIEVSGDPGAIRTRDPQLRRPKGRQEETVGCATEAAQRGARRHPMVRVTAPSPPDGPRRPLVIGLALCSTRAARCACDGQRMTG